MMHSRCWLSLPTAALVVVADVAALLALRPAPTQLRAQLAHPRQWTDAVGADAAVGALAGAALWLLAAWVAVGLIAAVAGQLPGVAGTAAGACARQIAAVALPRMLYRAVVGAAGLGVLLSPAVASAATARTTAPQPGGASTAAAGIAVPAPLPPTTVLPAPRLPIGHTPIEQARVEPAPPAPPPNANPPEPMRRTEPRTVTVRPGDSLWRIAAERLVPATPARIAATWPRWFAANRAVIGPDPDHLVPGEVLQAPLSSEESR